MDTLQELFATFQARGEKTAMTCRTGVRRLDFSDARLAGQSL